MPKKKSKKEKKKARGLVKQLSRPFSPSRRKSKSEEKDDLPFVENAASVNSTDENLYKICYLSSEDWDNNDSDIPSPLICKSPVLSSSSSPISPLSNEDADSGCPSSPTPTSDRCLSPTRKGILKNGSLSNGKLEDSDIDLVFSSLDDVIDNHTDDTKVWFPRISKIKSFRSRFRSQASKGRKIQRSHSCSDLLLRTTCHCSPCEWEVEVKLVEIKENNSMPGESCCEEIKTFKAKVCHHPGCTENNKNRPLLLCKECDKCIHSDPEFTGHLVLDAPKKRTAHPMLARGTSSPNIFPHSDTELNNQDGEDREDQDLDDVDGIFTKKAKKTDEGFQTGFRIPNHQESKLKRKKVIKSKRRHTDSAINNDEYFTVKFTDIDEEDIVIVAAAKGVCLQAVLQPILERKKVDIERVNIFVEASKTPLPLTCEAFLLGGNTLNIKKKESDGKPPIASRPAKSMYAAKTPKPAGGSLRGRRSINLSVDDGSNLMPSISPQGTLTLSEGKRIKNSNNLLTTLFSPLVRDREKQEQLSELLNTYSANGIPPMPKLLTLGRPEFDNSLFELEPHWSSIVDNASSLTKRQHDQQEAIWELLSTEVGYIKSLKVVTDMFMCCILNLQEESLLLEIEIESLFSNLSELLIVNSNFWQDHLSTVLKEARETRKPLCPSFLKEGFKKFHDTFLPYTKYCLEQKACADYMKSKYSESELFKTFVVWAESQKQFNRLGLQEFVAKPWKRLTIYSLLLQAILRKTDDERQRKDLLEMIGSVDRFVSYVNATLRQKHEQERLAVILRKIESYDAVESPNDECARFLHEYNNNFDLTTPMPGCNNHQSRVLIMQSPLRLKDAQSRMDVECLLFTDLLLVCKSSRRMDKYKIVKPPMRVDMIIVKELRDKGSFLVIHLNEYHVPVSAFTFHGDASSVRVWTEHIRKAQEQYNEAKREASRTSNHVDIEVVDEHIIEYPAVKKEIIQPMEISVNGSPESPDQFLPTLTPGQSMSEQASPTINNRSYSFSEYQKQDRTPSLSGAEATPTLTSPVSEHEHKTVHSSLSVPILQMLPQQEFPIDGETSPMDSLNFSASDIELSDENLKVKLKERRTSRSEKRYHTADYIQDLTKQENKDKNIYKRLSWNFGTSDLSIEKNNSLKGRVTSSESFRSIYSSSGVSSNGSLHQNPDPEISIMIEESDTPNDIDEVINEEMKKDISEMNVTLPEDLLNAERDLLSDQKHSSKSKSVNDIEELLKELSTSELEDGISSVALPKTDSSRKKLTHAQIMKMKKHLLLSANIEASEV
ncbi:hypothetical protein ScPMuIL_007813 [Solemya velum]